MSGEKILFGLCIFLLYTMTDLNAGRLCAFLDRRLYFGAASNKKEVVSESINSSKRNKRTSAKSKIGSHISAVKKHVIPLETRINNFNSELDEKYVCEVLGDELAAENCCATLNICVSNILQNSIDSLKTVKLKRLRIILHNDLKTVPEELEIYITGRSIKEWFTYLSDEMANTLKNGLFRPCNSKGTIEIKPGLEATEESLFMYEFYGKITGLALLNQKILNVCFSIPFLQSILQKNITLEHFRKEQPVIYKMWKNKSSSEIQSIIDDNYGERVKQQLNAFMKGCNEIIPQNLIKKFDAKELQQILCGNEITIEDAKFWHKHVKYVKCDKNLSQVKFFWQYVKSLNTYGLSRLIKFITGTPRLPLGGFKKIGLKIEPQTDKKINYCATKIELSTLYLPSCSNFEELKEQLENGMLKIEKRFE